ncbi:MAG: hypothetical protein JWM87_3193 [Candidatus Eremiobacteraeota bacterium]|nr:hypothetical protein [Candidatus Eremiobacteraeota bacterium]
MFNPARHTQANRITEITRRKIVDSLLLRVDDFHGRMPVLEFLRRIWDLAKMPSLDRRQANLEEDLTRHLLSFQDYTYSDVLYDHIRIVTCPDKEFGQFLALCLHPLVRPDKAQVATLLGKFNDSLAPDGFELVGTSQISGHAVFEMVDLSAPAMARPMRYDVALSFAGEQRGYVDVVANALEQAGVRVFYDRFEEASLWGKDLAERFEEVFLHRARFCVMFLSADYAAKIWPTYERRNAVASALQKQEEYILPVRFDDTDVPGIRHTIGYQDARIKTPDEIAELILKKLGRAAH